MVTPEDDDRFVISCEEAIARCRSGESPNITRADIAKMLHRCRAWGAENERQVLSIYIAPCDGRMGVFVVPRTSHFDFDLAEKVAELSHEMARDYPAVRPEAIQVPGNSLESLQCFVDNEEAACVYGAASKSPHEVDA